MGLALDRANPFFTAMSLEISKMLTTPGAVGFVSYGKKEVFLFQSDPYFEIGSLTKLLTADLISNELNNKTMSLTNTLGDFFPLPSGNKYPTIVELLTHSAGYQKDYFEWKSILRCWLKIDKSISYPYRIMLSRLKKTIPKDSEKKYIYSNFGYAVLGLILEKIYNKPYYKILDEYLSSLQLYNTGVNICKSANYWVWKTNNSFIASGGVTSTINDMLSFTKYMLDKTSEYSSINLLRYFSLEDEVQPDDVGTGMSWKMRKDRTLYHTGCTENFKSYISLQKEKRKGVVVLLKDSSDDWNKAIKIARNIEKILY